MIELGSGMTLFVGSRGVPGYYSASIISLDLNVRKLLILYGKNKVDFDFFLFLLNKFDAFFNRKMRPISANLKIPSP